MQQQVDVLVAAAARRAAAAAKRATTVPVTFIEVGEPVASGFIASYARPGRNLKPSIPYQYRYRTNYEDAPGMKGRCPGKDRQC